jgi:hypothetical protein
VNAYFYTVALGALAVLAFLFGEMRGYVRGVRDATQSDEEDLAKVQAAHAARVLEIARAHASEVEEIHVQYQEEIDGIKRQIMDDARLRSTVVVEAPAGADLEGLDDTAIGEGTIIEGQVPHILSTKIRGQTSWRCACGKDHQFHEPTCTTCSKARPYRS